MKGAREMDGQGTIEGAAAKRREEIVEAARTLYEEKGLDKPR